MKTVLSFDVGFRNLAFCACVIDTAETENLPRDTIEVSEWVVEDIVVCSGSKAKSKNIGMERLCRMMVTYLRSKESLWTKILGCDSDDADPSNKVVVIEQQLGRAHTMKMLQYCIFVYFQTVFPDVPVKFCHAKHKLKTDISGFGVNESEFEPVATKRRKRKDSNEEPSQKLLNQRRKAQEYKLRKNKAKWSVAEMLKVQQPAWIDHFEGHSKKDDLADCLLQAIAHVQL